MISALFEVSLFCQQFSSSLIFFLQNILKTWYTICKKGKLGFCTFMHHLFSPTQYIQFYVSFKLHTYNYGQIITFIFCFIIHS